MEELALAYGFYYGSYLTSENKYMKALHGKIVEYMDIKFADKLGKDELVEMKSEIIDSLREQEYLPQDVAEKTKKIIRKHVG